MTTTSKNDAPVTLINVFTVSHHLQQRLVDMLVEAKDHVMKGLPGFVSANIHKSPDGVRVVNYAQWRSTEDFEAMMADPATQAHMTSIEALAGYDAHLYVIADSGSSPSPQA